MYSAVYSLLIDVQEIMSTDGKATGNVWSDKTMIWAFMPA